MADGKINKPKAKKTSDSVTSPRLCPTSDTYPKDTDCNTSKIKSRFIGSRIISHEKNNRSGLADPPRINLPKSNLTKFRNIQGFRFKDNVSLTAISPKNYHGSIPVSYRYSFNAPKMSPPAARTPSPLKKNLPNELKISSKVKTITLDYGKKKNVKRGARSPSPFKRIQGSYKRTTNNKPRGSSPVSLKSPEKTTIIKRKDTLKQYKSPRINLPTSRKSKINSFSNVEVLSREKIQKQARKPKFELNNVVLKQASQPSFSKKESYIQAKEKISLDHLKNEMYTEGHNRLSFEKVHVCIKKNGENLSVAGSKRFLTKYSSEDLQKKEEISLSFLQNISSEKITSITESEDDECRTKKLEAFDRAIRTLSGNELILTPSIKLEMDKEEIGSHDIEISELLHETGESFEDSKDIQLLQDDANEYDSEVSTDGESSRPQNDSHDLLKKGSYCLWKNRNSEILNDVDYRQSVYHPAVSRQQNIGNIDFRPSNSTENNYGFSNEAKGRVAQSHSSNLKNKFSSNNFNTVDDASIDRSWNLTFDESDNKSIYSSSIQDVQMFGSIKILERTRTRKERISGAMLKSTLKVIRLLALFNLWPGDFCHMLTAQSLRLAR